MQTSPAHHLVLLLVAGGLLACSSKSAFRTGIVDGSTSGDGSGAGDKVIVTGGEVPQGSTRGEVDGAAFAIDADGLLDSPCDLASVWGLLWRRFNTATGSLVQTSCFPDTGIFMGGLRGQLVFNDSGQIIDDTYYVVGPGGPSKSEWLTSVASFQWPCAAGTMVPYVCESAGD